MYITYKIIRFSPNFVGIRMFTSGMTSKLPNDLKCELLMAVCRYLFVIQGCPHSTIIFWEKDRNRRDSAFSTEVEKTEYDAILFLRTPRFSTLRLFHRAENAEYDAIFFLRTPRFPHSDFSTEWKTRSLHELGLRSPHSHSPFPLNQSGIFPLPVFIFKPATVDS